MPERSSPAQPNYLRFVSTPTIDIEPKKDGYPAIFSGNSAENGKKQLTLANIVLECYQMWSNAR